MGGLILSVDIVFARGADDLDGLSEVIREYLSFTADQYREISSIEIDAEAYLKKTFSEIDSYYPPRGRFLLAREGQRLIGIGSLKPIRDETCEIKRMYVLPDQRGKGLGKMILVRLIDEAKEIGYAKILLEVACFSTAAISLYRAMGFTDTDRHLEAETDEAFREYLVYLGMKI